MFAALLIASLLLLLVAMAVRFAGLKTDEMRALVENRIGRWTADFRLDEPAGRMAP